MDQHLTLRRAVAAGTIATIAFVQAARQTKDKPTISSRMFYHKSFGLLTGSLFGGFCYKVAQGQRVTVPVTTVGIGACIAFQYLTGISMGYFGGWGVPFFGLFKVPGASTPNKAIGNNSYFAHKRVGVVMKALIVIHALATVWCLYSG